MDLKKWESITSSNDEPNFQRKSNSVPRFGYCSSVVELQHVNFFSQVRDVLRIKLLNGAPYVLNVLLSCVIVASRAAILDVISAREGSTSMRVVASVKTVMSMMTI